jgi:hypothetical protein
MPRGLKTIFWRRGIVIDPPTNSFRREGKPQGCRGPLNKFGIEKDVERRDLAIANNGDIQFGVVWGLAFRA